MIPLPRLYAILDSSCFPNREQMLEAAEEWVRAGVTLIQYRNKTADAGVMLQEAMALRERTAIGEGSRGVSLRRTAKAARPHTAQGLNFIMNDRADLCLAAGFGGVHVGQDDLAPESVRRIIGPERWLGVSTHNPEQVREADSTSADYVAIGPVFGTASKANPDPVVGLDGVRQARKLTRKPLVAIGGITRQNCLTVLDAGADTVAVISDLVREPRKSVEEFLAILG